LIYRTSYRHDITEILLKVKHICDLCYFLQLSYIKYNGIGGVMTNVHASSVVDRGFIGGVMVSVHASSVIDRGFVGFSLNEMMRSLCSRPTLIGIL
jgi:hypothetical protein